jgi:hypothetical protein
MRILEYDVLPPVGAGKLRTSGSLKDLVLAIPYLVQSSLIPPLAVLNAVFTAGVADAGMSGGCRWQPFEISKDEYDELIRAFRADTKGNFEAADAPEWVKTPSDWSIWIIERMRGVPAAEH